MCMVLYYAEQLTHCTLLWQPLARGSPCTAVSSHHARNRRCFKKIFVGLVSCFCGQHQNRSTVLFYQWATDKLRCETLTCLIAAFSATVHQTNSQRKSSWHAQCCSKLQVQKLMIFLKLNKRFARQVGKCWDFVCFCGHKPLRT